MTPQAVLPTLAEASRAAETIENPPSRVALMASISRLLHRAGDGSTAATTLSAALAVARTIPEDGARASALADVAETQAAIDAPDAARTAIAEALAAVPTAGGGKERTSAQAATDDIAAARATAERVHEPYIRDRDLLDIADRAESAGRYWEALSASRAIVNCAERAHSLASVARAQGKGGDLPGATRSCAEALTATRGIEDEVERVLALAHICEVQNANGEIAAAARSMAEALSVSEAIHDDESCVYALAFLARHQPTLDYPSRVPHMIARALAVARGIADTRDRAYAFCQIAQTQARTGDRTAALRLIAEAFEAANRMTCASGSNDILSAIAEAQAAAADNLAALATARRLAGGCERDALLRVICEVQCRENNFREGIATAREIATAWIRSSAFADIARLRTQGGAVSEAAQPIALAVEAAGAIGNSSRRAEACQKSPGFSSIPSQAAVRPELLVPWLFRFHAVAARIKSLSGRAHLIVAVESPTPARSGSRNRTGRHRNCPRSGPHPATRWSRNMTEPDPHDPETGGASPDKPAHVRKPRGIRFSDSEWEEVRTAAARNDVPVAEFVRERILEIARGRAAADISGIPADLAPLIERTFRYTYMLATQKRDELIQDGRGDEMKKLVKAARDLQDSLQQGVSR